MKGRRLPQWCYRGVGRIQISILENAVGLNAATPTEQSTLIASPVRREKRHSARLSILENAVGLNVDSRARQLGGEAGILALFSDCEGELIIGNKCAHSFRGRIDDVGG